MGWGDIYNKAKNRAGQLGKNGLVFLTLGSGAVPKASADYTQTPQPVAQTHTIEQTMSMADININNYLSYQSTRFNNETPTINVDYAYSNNTETDASAWYSPDKNTIHFQADTQYINTTLAHEVHHRNLQQSGIYELDMSLEQNYQLHCHDEISANLAGLMQKRQEYLSAKTPEEKQKIIDNCPSEYAYYFDAVKNGKINPESKSPDDFDNEMKFITKKNYEHWMDNYQEYYNPLHREAVALYATEKDYDKLVTNDENYNKTKKSCYMIGGIDFSKYMTQEVEIPQQVKQAQHMIEQKDHKLAIHEVLLMEQNKTRITDRPLYDMSLEQTAKLQHHKQNADDIRNLQSYRKKWLEANNSSDGQASTVNIEMSSELERKWTLAVLEGKIKPEGDKFTPEEQDFIKQNCSYEIGDYNYTQIADAMGKLEATYNLSDYGYKLNRLNIYSDCGLDNLDGLAEPQITDPNIVTLSSKYKIYDISDPTQLNLRPFNKDTDIVFVTPNIDSSIKLDEQINIARQTMFWENAKAHNPEIVKAMDGMNNAEKAQAVNQIIGNFQQKLQSNPYLMAQYNEYDVKMCQHLESVRFFNNGANSNNTIDSSHIYNTGNENLDIQCQRMVSSSLPEMPKEISEIINNHENNNIDTKQSTAYYGVPKYDKNEEVLYATIYDMQQPFLANELISRKQYQFTQYQETQNAHQATIEQEVNNKSAGHIETSQQSSSTMSATDRIMMLRGLKTNTTTTPTPKQNYTQTLSQQQMNNLLTNRER